MYAILRLVFQGLVRLLKIRQSDSSSNVGRASMDYLRVVPAGRSRGKQPQALQVIDGAASRIAERMLAAHEPDSLQYDGATTVLENAIAKRAGYEMLAVHIDELARNSFF